MDATTIPTDERTLVVQVFGELRQSLKDYMIDRDFLMSNAQVFTYLIYAPICLAIASDGVVDEHEIILLEAITKDADVNKTVNLDLHEIIAIAPEPSNIMLNEEFNMRIDAELLYLSRNINKYEKNIISAVKSLLKIDSKPTSETSFSATFSKWFEFVVERNLSKNKEEQLKKIKDYKQKIGLK